ncbi:replication factor-A carboxy-terminal domain protein [Trifolium pratense]|uniref:Replication factor-A carboxy-terminal domain protein n=1 Tax=Trifolium pratense TaxID=57577 RepID=A0A2K3N7R6_TRIPR|nr:replication factor-A carboxy-terminal domain protein [Trifolium pratense]
MVSIKLSRLDSEQKYNVKSSSFETKHISLSVHISLSERTLGSKTTFSDPPSSQLQHFRIMARAFEFVKDITNRKDLWKVVVKVKDKWSGTKDGKEYFEIVVVDSKGDDILVLVPHELKQKFEIEIPIIVNKTYTMQNFQVSKNDDKFKPSHHEFKLRFNDGTLVNDVNVHQIVDPVPNFKSFTEINYGHFREDYLYDIIGMVDELGFQQPHPGNRKVQSNFVLRDLGNNVINCTLWENYALKFFNLQNKSNDGPIIVFMKYAKIKAAGKYALTISNTWTTTKLFINEDVREIIEFKKSLTAGIENGTITAVAETPSQMMSQSSGRTQFTPYTPEQKFYHNAEVMPLSKIVQLPQDTKCVTVVTTVKVI